jgi:hypothetical protein
MNQATAIMPQEGTDINGIQSNKVKSEAMQLDRILLNALLGQELEYLGSLIPLKLDHCPHVFILYQRPIARELL